MKSKTLVVTFSTASLIGTRYRNDAISSGNSNSETCKRWQQFQSQPHLHFVGHRNGSVQHAHTTGQSAITTYFQWSHCSNRLQCLMLQCCTISNVTLRQHNMKRANISECCIRSVSMAAKWKEMLFYKKKRRPSNKPIGHNWDSTRERRRSRMEAGTHGTSCIIFNEREEADAVGVSTFSISNSAKKKFPSEIIIVTLAPSAP